jgi:hypothetical protein
MRLNDAARSSRRGVSITIAVAESASIAASVTK